MKTFKSFLEEIKKPTGKLKSACWTGYTAVGTKEKNGKTVPNCVPVKEDGEGSAISAGPTNVTGTATSTDPVSATAVNMKKQKKPIIITMDRRAPPKI